MTQKIEPATDEQVAQRKGWCRAILKAKRSRLTEMMADRCSSMSVAQGDLSLIARIREQQAEIDKLKSQPDVTRLVDCAKELIEVATLRGDNDLPHPSNDAKLWTARMQDAWNELESALAQFKSDPRVCEWEISKRMDDYGAHTSTCDRVEFLPDGDLDVRKFKYCPYCGLPIKVSEPKKGDSE